MRKIRPRNHNHRREQGRIYTRLGSKVEHPEHEQIAHRISGFDQGILDGDRHMARTAPATQEQVADNRDVVVHRDRLPTGRAM